MLARAEVMRWQAWELAHFGRALGEVLYERLFKRMKQASPDAGRVAQGLSDFASHASVLEVQLARGPWVTGDTLSLADFSLGALLPLAPYARVDLQPYPGIRRWLERLDALPAWQQSATPEPMLAWLRSLAA